MPHFRILWEIDSWAGTPEWAAFEARQAMRDPDSLATAFTVRELDERGNAVSETAVDLEGWAANGPEGLPGEQRGETRNGPVQSGITTTRKACHVARKREVGGSLVTGSREGNKMIWYRVVVTGPRFGWSVTYRDARGPEDALRDRLQNEQPGRLPREGCAKVVPVWFDEQKQAWVDGEPARFYRYSLAGDVAIQATKDKRVRKSLRRH